MLFKRREFLQTSAMATTSMLLPKFLKSLNNTGSLVPKGNKVLVVVQFSGGNDGLNTIIPVRDDIYFRERPSIGIKKSDALSLTDDASIHPSLPYFKTLHDEGCLSIMNSVGYPEPDRSHFRSMDIWQSASRSDQYLSDGWLGRFLDNVCHDCDNPTQALEIDDILSLALKGKDRKGIAFKDPRNLFNGSNVRYFKDLSHDHDHSNETVEYLYKTLADTLSSAEYIYDKSRIYSSNVSYPSTDLGRKFKTISSLILSDINTKVYYVSLGSFDTHVGQPQKQANLFTQLNDAVKSFTADLKNAGRFDDVLLMTFSEFGRRVKQNASNGTDHGSGNNMFFISGGLKKKGLLNELPDLSDLDKGDLKYKVDFKNVYATVLNKWLNANDKNILGGSFNLLDFI